MFCFLFMKARISGDEYSFLSFPWVDWHIHQSSWSAICGVVEEGGWWCAQVRHWQSGTWQQYWPWMMDVVVDRFIRIGPAVWISYVHSWLIYCVFVSEASSGSLCNIFSACFLCVLVVVLEVVLVCNKTVHHPAPYLQNLSPESTKFLHNFLLHQQTVRPLGSDSPLFKLSAHSKLTDSIRSITLQTHHSNQSVLWGAPSTKWCGPFAILWHFEH